MKNLVNIWYIFVRGLVDIFKQFVWFITKRKQRNR